MLCEALQYWYSILVVYIFTRFNLFFLFFFLSLSLFVFCVLIGLKLPVVDQSSDPPPRGPVTAARAAIPGPGERASGRGRNGR